MSMVAVHRWIYAVLTLNFWIPVCVYILDPQAAVASFGDIGTALGFGPYGHTEDSVLWYVLGVANVSTLGFCCALLWWDVRRWFAVLVPLVWLKGWASLGFLVYFAVVEPWPSYLAASVFDGLTVVTMIASAVAAKRELDSGVPGLHNLVVRRPEVVLATLEKLQAKGVVERVPNLWQVALGALYMRYRMVFRPDSIGVGEVPVRDSARARLLALRPIRAPFLLRERAIAPFEMTGLSLAPDFLERHLLGAYHPREHALYDLELLALHEGALGGLREKLVEVVEERSARGTWLKDLCVHEGYHETLLGLVDRALAGDFEARDLAIPSDATLAGYLRWCASQPATPSETWRAWRAGRFSFDPAMAAA